VHYTTGPSRVVLAYFIYVLRIYIYNILCFRRFIYIYSHSAVAAVLQTIRPSCMMPTHLRPSSTSDPAHKPSLIPHVSRHTTVIPHPSTTTPPVSHSLYTLYTITPSISARPRASRDLRAAEFTACTFALSPSRSLPHTPADATIRLNILLYGVYAHAALSVFPLHHFLRISQHSWPRWRSDDVYYNLRE